MPVSYFTDTSRVLKPWRPQGLYAQAIRNITNQNNDPNSPTNQALSDMGGQQMENPANSYGSQIAQRIGQLKGTPTASKDLKSLIPSEAAASLTAGSQRGFSNPWLQQLQGITDLGTKATDIQRARGAFRAAQDAANAKANAGGGASFPGFSGDLSKARQLAIQYARKQLGVPYVWGGESPGRAFDCSGLVQYAYRKAGISLPRVSQEQMTRGVRTSIKNLVPGDLVGWGHPAHHIAIYLGGGRIIEAPHTGANVRIMSLSQKGGGYWGIHLRI